MAATKGSSAAGTFSGELSALCRFQCRFHFAAIAPATMTQLRSPKAGDVHQAAVLSLQRGQWRCTRAGGSPRDLQVAVGSVANSQGSLFVAGPLHAVTSPSTEP